MAGEPSVRDANGVPSLVAVDPSIAIGDSANLGANVKRLHVLKDPVTISGQAYNPLVVYDANSSGGPGGGGTEFDDGDAIDTDSQGTLILGTTDVPGTARAVIVDDDGHLQVDILSAPTITIQDGGNVITVDGTVAVSSVGGTVAVTQSTSPWVVSGTVNAVLSEPISVDDNGGSLTVDDGGSSLSIDDGGNVITVDGTVTIQDGGNVITVDATNLDIRDLTSASDSVSCVQSTTPWTEQGAAAHDAAVSGNPVFIGYRASEAMPTRVSADGDMVQSWGDRFGRLLVMRGSPTVNSATFTAFDPSGGASTTVINAPGANTAIFLLSMHLSNDGGLGRITLNSRSAVPVNTAFFNGILGTGENAINYHWQTWEQLLTNQALAVTGAVSGGGLTAPNFSGYFEYFTAAV